MKQQRKKTKTFERKIKKEWKNIAFNIAIMLGNILIIILLFKRPLISTAALMILAIFSLVKWKSWTSLGVFVFASLFCSIFEMLIVSFNVWSYSYPHIGNVPLWLFVSWGIVGSWIYQMAIELERLGVHKK